MTLMIWRLWIFCLFSGQMKKGHMLHTCCFLASHEQQFCCANHLLMVFPPRFFHPLQHHPASCKAGKSSEPTPLLTVCFLFLMLMEFFFINLRKSSLYNIDIFFYSVSNKGLVPKSPAKQRICTVDKESEED